MLPSSWLDPVIATLALLGAFCIARYLYQTVTPRPEGDLPDALSPAGMPDNIDLLELLSRHQTRSLCTGNALEVLVNGDRIFEAMLGAIDEAEHSIHLLTYVYWRGEIAERFAGALARAARREVRVLLLLDAIGSSSMEQRLADDMRHAGVEIAYFHPVRWYNMARINLRTHRKVLVVDSRVGFTGGVGIAQEWAGDARNAQEWRDNHFRLTGPAVRYLEGAFAENWLNATGKLLVNYCERCASDTRDADESGAGSRVVTIASASRGKLSSIAFAYWLSIAMAQRQLDIATPYFVPNRRILAALKAAAGRGVRVRLLLPGEHNDSKLVKWASLAYYPELLEAGVEVYEFQPAMMHTKTIVTDGRWCTIGSANFDNRSFELNDEILLMVDSHQLASDITVQFDRDIDRSQKVSQHTINRVELLVKAASQITLLMRAQL